MKKTLILITVTVLLFEAGCKKSSKTPEPPLTNATIHIEVLSQNLSFPWELVWGPDNMIWMTERSGKISRVNPSTGTVSLLTSISDVKSTGEGGLLGMVLHRRCRESG